MISLKISSPYCTREEVSDSTRSDLMRRDQTVLPQELPGLRVESRQRSEQFGKLAGAVRSETPTIHSILNEFVDRL